MWFHNPEEEPYTASSSPQRVLLTFGDSTEWARNVSWQCDNVVQHLPLVCVTGNHDYLKGGIVSLERRFSLIHSYYLDSQVGVNQIFTFRYGPAQFFLLDSNREFPYLFTQRHWLEEKFKSSTARWKILHSI